MKNDEKKFLNPWENEDGTIKSTEEIKSLCENWNMSTWEQYLKTIEVMQIECPLADGRHIDNVSQHQYANLFIKLMGQDDYPETARVARAALDILPQEQKAIIFSLYWDGKSLSQVAKDRSQARKTIRIQRDLALKKLADVLLSGAVEKAISTSKKLKKKTGSPHSPCVPPQTIGEKNNFSHKGGQL